MATVTVAAPYTPGPIEPIVMVGENVGVWTQQTYLFFKVVHIEAIPASRQLIQDLGSVADAGSIASTEITVARAQDGNLLHVRVLPLDEAEITVFEQRATARNTVYSAQARLTYWNNLDPYLAQNTYFVLGKEKTIYMAANNVRGYALSQCRIQFTGYRYVLSPLPALHSSALRKTLQGIELEAEEGELIKRGLRATVVPAEGRE